MPFSDRQAPVLLLGARSGGFLCGCSSLEHGQVDMLLSAVFGHCCCQDGEDNYQLELPRQQPEALPVLQDDPRDILMQAQPAATLKAPRTKAASSASEFEGKQAQDRAAEKVRLQNLVKEFSRKAVLGIRCGFVNPATGQVALATYRLDKILQKFVVSVDGAAEELTCDLRQITDIQTVETGGESCLPPKAQVVLSADVKARLLVLSCKGKPGNMCILEGSRSEQDTFMTCMKILRLYTLQRLHEQAGC